MEAKPIKIKKSEQKLNAYQMLMFDDEPLTPERKLWLSVFRLEEGQDKLRRGLYREIGELKKENISLKQSLWNLKETVCKEDLFSDLFAEVQ